MCFQIKSPALLSTVGLPLQASQPRLALLGDLGLEGRGSKSLFTSLLCQAAAVSPPPLGLCWQGRYGSSICWCPLPLDDGNTTSLLSPSSLGMVAVSISLISELLHRECSSSQLLHHQDHHFWVLNCLFFKHLEWFMFVLLDGSWVIWFSIQGTKAFVLE